MYLLKLSSQTWPLTQIMYIYLGGPVQSFKILTYEIKLFLKMFLLWFCPYFVFFFFLFFLSSTQILLTAIFLVFISKLYSSQFPAAES